MARKSIPKKARQTAPLSNQALIAQCLTMFNMVDENSNQEILELLLRQEGNLDCIIDDAERVATASKYGWDLPTNDERVAYINSQINQSTSEKGRKAWMDMLKGDMLVNHKAYHALRNQRLREQIRQTKKKEEDASKAAEAQSIATNSSGRVESFCWSSVENIPLKRIPTFSSKLDEWFGSSIEYVKRGNKEEEIRNHGMVKGFSYAFGAKQGMGKTRFLVRMLRDLCGPKQVRDDGIEFGGMSGLYIQGEMGMSMFNSTFLRNVWKEGEVNVKFSEATLLRDVAHLVERDLPDIIVIDSKDMIYEFSGPPSRVKDGMLRFNELLERTGTTAIVTSHVSKSKGDLKGSSEFAYLCHAIILGRPDEHVEGHFNIWLDKNRSGPINNHLRWVHKQHTVEIDEDKVIKDPNKPEMTRLSARDGGTDLASSILAGIEMAQGIRNQQ